jgi:hypothetical protein
MPKFSVVAAVAAVFFATLSPAQAACYCQCVDGEVRPLCDRALDLPPICPPRICGIQAPSIAPISPPTIPPIGTSSCQQRRVCDMFNNCRWQQICQ